MPHKKKKALSTKPNAKPPAKTASLVNAIRAMPRARCGPYGWAEALRLENPALMAEIDAAIDVYWQRVRAGERLSLSSAALLLIKLAKLDMKEQQVGRYIKEREPQQ
jgi:hypothetical protein